MKNRVCLKHFVNDGRSKVMPVFVFSLLCHLWLFKIGANFLCNSLLHRNIKHLISGQVLFWSSRKRFQNENDYSLKLNIKTLVKYVDEGVQLALLFYITFPNSSKQFQNNILRPNNKRKFETWNHVFFLRWKSWFFAIFPKFGNSKYLVTS